MQWNLRHVFFFRVFKIGQCMWVVSCELQLALSPNESNFGGPFDAIQVAESMVLSPCQDTITEDTSTPEEPFNFQEVCFVSMEAKRHEIYHS